MCHLLSIVSLCFVTFGCVFMFTGVAGRGRRPSVCEDREETGGWCVEQLSLTPAGFSLPHTASKGKKNNNNSTFTQTYKYIFLFTTCSSLEVRHGNMSVFMHDLRDCRMFIIQFISLFEVRSVYIIISAREMPEKPYNVIINQ